MSQKPSDRIRELYLRWQKVYTEQEKSAYCWTMAVMDYLDEQAEKSQEIS